MKVGGLLPEKEIKSKTSIVSYYVREKLDIDWNNWKWLGMTGMTWKSEFTGMSNFGSLIM